MNKKCRHIKTERQIGFRDKDIIYDFFNEVQAGEGHFIIHKCKQCEYPVTWIGFGKYKKGKKREKNKS